MLHTTVCYEIIQQEQITRAWKFPLCYYYTSDGSESNEKPYSGVLHLYGIGNLLYDLP